MLISPRHFYFSCFLFLSQNLFPIIKTVSSKRYNNNKRIRIEFENLEINEESKND